MVFATFLGFAEMDRIHVLGVFSTAFSTMIVSKAFIERKGHFFATCIQITQSNLHLMILLGMTFYYVILSGKLIQRLWFGQLRAFEVDHLFERSWYSVMDTCLGLTMFRDGFDLLFVIRFGTLLFCKTFHWIVGDRVEFMNQQAETNWRFHFRMTSIMAVLFAFDVAMLYSAIINTMLHGPTMLIVFGFEYALMTSLLLGIFAKYLLHTIDMNCTTPWEEKPLYFFYVDLILDFVKLVSYCAFFGIVVHYYGFPLHIVRDVYMTLRSFLQRVKDLMRYREATRNMEERYPTATPAELADTDSICIVCRDDMHLPENGPISKPETPKKLPCGHIFHFRCLRNWLERQQACPTCRHSVLERPTSQPTVVPQPAAPPAEMDVPIPQNVLQQEEPQQEIQYNIPPQQIETPPHAPTPRNDDLNLGSRDIVYPITFTPLDTEITSLNERGVQLIETKDLENILKRLEDLELIKQKLTDLQNMVGDLLQNKRD